MPEIINRTEERVHIDNIQPHPANPNDGDVAAIAESIRQNGFYGRIVVRDSTGKILAGEHRWRAAQEVGLAEVPIERVECDDETAMRILLADNRTAEKAEREPEPLADLLESLETTDDGLTGTGYENDDLDELLADLERNGHSPTEEPSYGPTEYDIDVETGEEYDFPTLDPQMQPERIPVPVRTWGDQARDTEAGMIDFYTEDYKFEGLLDTPDRPAENAQVLVEANYSTGRKYPYPLFVRDLFWKRWLAQRWQQAGASVIADLNVHPQFWPITLASLPEGWEWFGFRSHSEDPDEMVGTAYEFAQAIHGDPITFVLVGGPAEENRKWAQAHDSAWIPERKQRHEKRHDQDIYNYT